MSDETKLLHTVAQDVVGTRLDIWLATLPEIQSRNQAIKLIEAHRVKVSGVLPLKVKASYRLRGGENVEIEIPEVVSSHIIPENINIEILYQDNDIAVIVKPAGMVTHPAAGHAGGTLVNALQYHLKDLSNIGGVERPGLVHRLDRDTSGVLVVAKNNKAHKGLSEQFKSHEIHRVYWAVVSGVPREKKRTIESHLARHPVHRKAFASQEVGKHAVTHFELLDHYQNQASLLAVTLETGRTHQIRVHLSEMGHPVFGDKLYGVKRQKNLTTNSELKSCLKNIPRHVLHAAELGFEHPRTKQQMKFKAPWPEDLKTFLGTLEKIK